MTKKSSFLFYNLEYKSYSLEEVLLYIVAEYLFLENLIINYIILQGTKDITRTKVSNKKIILVSITLALYPFAMFFPSLNFLLKTHIKIIVSFLAVKCAFNSKSNAIYIKQVSAFYVLSFIFAGASIGFYYFDNSFSNSFNFFNNGFSIKYLVLGVAFGAVVIKNLLNYYYEKTEIDKNILNISVILKGREARIYTLLDTGNSLVEPMTKCPVFVVEYRFIKELIPDLFKNIYETNRDNDFIEIEKMMENLKEDISIRLIPFKSISSSSNILIGFKPNYIIVHGQEDIFYEDLIIGIYNGELTTDNQYNGLLNQEIINRGSVNVY